MLKEIANNEFYNISVDSAKNRVYIKVIGAWVKASNVSNYVTDLKEALSHITKGYTILTDLSEMKLQSQELNAIHVEAQKHVVAAGIGKVAEIAPKDTIVKLQLEKINKESGMQKKMYDTKEEAEKTLD